MASDQVSFCLTHFISASQSRDNVEIVDEPKPLNLWQLEPAFNRICCLSAHTEPF